MNLKKKNGDSFLHTICKHYVKDQAKIMTSLVEDHKLDVYSKNKYGNAPIHYLLNNSKIYLSSLNYLLSFKENVNIAGNFFFFFKILLIYII